MADKLYHIGRDKFKNQIYINDDSVSSVHAQLIFSENNWVLVDLKSSNGTFVNNQKVVSPIKIQNNDDIIKFGKFLTKKQNILNSVRKYEFEKKKNTSCSVPLKGDRHVIIESDSVISGDNHSNENRSKRKISLTSILIGMLILLCVAALIVGIVFLVNQNKIADANDNNNDTEQVEDDEDDEDDEERGNTKPKPKKQKKINYKKYDFSCYGKLLSNRGPVKIGEEVEDILLSNIKVSRSDEVAFGKSVYNRYKRKYTILSSGYEYNKLKRILRELESKLASPRGFNYKLYFVKDKQINAFTAGGYIFFHEGMYDFCENDSELAAVLSHEIAHNELGHIKDMAKKHKAGVLELDQIFRHTIGGAFNQKDEAACDLFGMDLIFPTNYKNCAAMDLWDRMSKNRRSDLLSDFFSTHPAPKKRSHCIGEHLNKHYNMNCE